MKLEQAILTNEQLVKEGYRLPLYDIGAVKEKTRQEPTWLQLGAGNIFRAFLGSCQQELLNKGLAQTGIFVAEGYDFEIVDILRSYDELTINVTLKESGDVDKEIVGSIVDYLKMDTASNDFQQIISIVESPTLQMISLTITEKGYSLTDNAGVLTSFVQSDFDNGPSSSVSYLGKLATLLYKRFKAGAHPIALVSMDNMSHNGEKLQQAILAYVEAWHQRGFVDQAFVDYMTDEQRVAFPWSMIDKITPRPDHTVQAMLEETGFSDIAARTTDKHTFVAPYVNGEQTQYLIIEDAFPNGKPALDQAGIIFTSRDTVNAVETMKVTTCLNPLHTALAIYGCLLNYTYIHEEMKDSSLVGLIHRLGYKEGLVVVKDPEIIDPKQFIDEVIQVRFPNPFIPDTPQRIATDTSQKLSVRYGETLKAYQSQALDVHSLEAIPFVFAGWLRYLSGIDDQGNSFERSADPLAARLFPLFNDFKFGQQSITPEIEALLKDETVFGVDLYAIGLADKVITYYQALSAHVGAIQETLATFN